MEQSEPENRLQSTLLPTNPPRPKAEKTQRETAKRLFELSQIRDSWLSFFSRGPSVFRQLQMGDAESRLPGKASEEGFTTTL